MANKKILQWIWTTCGSNTGENWRQFMMWTGLGSLWWHRFRSAGPVPDPVCVPPPVVLLLQDTGKYHMLGSGWQTHRVCAELIPTSGWSQNECEPIYSDQYVFVYNISDTKIYWVHWEKKINMLIYIILLQPRIALKKIQYRGQFWCTHRVQTHGITVIKKRKEDVN